MLSLSFIIFSLFLLFFSLFLLFFSFLVTFEPPFFSFHLSFGELYRFNAGKALPICHFDVAFHIVLRFFRFSNPGRIASNVLYHVQLR